MTMTYLPPPVVGTCPCGGVPQLRAKPITQKRRPKFGAMWLLATLLTGGLALGLYIVWPRHKVTIAVDRWMECPTCHRRSA